MNVPDPLLPHRRSRRRCGARAPRVLAVPVALALLALAGCSGGSDDGDDVGPYAGPGLTTPAVAPAPAAPPTPAPDCGDPRLSLRPPAAVPPASAWPPDSTMARIRARGWMIAGVDQSTYPFGYRDPVDNRLKGFDIDLVRAVAKAIFGDDRDERIQFRVLRNADRVPVVERGEVDIVAMTMTVNCERRARVDFSDIYFVAGQDVLVQNDPALPARVRDGLTGLAGYRVCAVPGSTSLERIKDPRYRAVPVEGETWADCLVKLQKGEADAVSTDDTILAGLQAQDPRFTVVAGHPVSEEPYGLAIARQNADFVRFVNAVLADLRRTGGWAAIYRANIGDSLPGRTQPPAVTAWRDAP